MLTQMSQVFMNNSQYYNITCIGITCEKKIVTERHCLSVYWVFLLRGTQIMTTC